MLSIVAIVLASARMPMPVPPLTAWMRSNTAPAAETAVPERIVLPVNRACTVDPETAMTS